MSINKAMKSKIIPLIAGVLYLCSGTWAGCNNHTSLAEARKGFKTTLVKRLRTQSPVIAPPPGLFGTVEFPGPIGNMPAYLSIIPQDKKLRPAMIWITGGFGNEIGDVWSAQDPSNDQSAAEIWKAGIITMYPAQRGGNTSPGYDESCFGEIDDIIAAAEYLKKQPGVDPKRIYLGGHSTGGTKAILAAECSDLFRATFSFGPVASVDYYGPENVAFNVNDKKEVELRAPIEWLPSLSRPLFVFEGTGGNFQDLNDFKARAKKEDNKMAHFYVLLGKSHFSTLQPTCKLIAKKILADTAVDKVNIDFTAQDLMAPAPF